MPHADNNDEITEIEFEPDFPDEMDEDPPPVHSPRVADALHEHQEDPVHTASKARWCRPVFDLGPENTAIISFQQMDTDYYSARPREDMCAFALDACGLCYQLYDGQVPIMRLYGVTESGNSILAHVHGYAPYFYIQAPCAMTDAMILEFAENLEQDVKLEQSKDRMKPGVQTERFIRYVELETKQTIWNYQKQDEIDFLRIVTVLPQHVHLARKVLERGFRIASQKSTNYLTYESTVNFVMRYMVDAGIVGANWVTLPSGTYLHRISKSTTCDIEVDIMWEKLVSHPPEGDWLKVAPLRILSFDIECAGRKGCFPEADKDPVIQIANSVTLQGSATPFVRNVFTLNTCAPITGAEVHSFHNERDMLRAWRNFLVTCDADVLTGYNIVGFDIPYLMDRAEALEVDSFALLGRITTNKSRIRKTKISSAQMGTRELNEITIEGRVIFDVFQAVQREYKLHSYTLNSVSAKFLGEQKEDVHHSIISDLQNGDDETRRRLAVYCLKDAYLPQRLLDKLMFLINYMEMARVTGVPMGWLLVRGQMLKVLSQLLRKARTKGLLLPNLPQAKTDAEFEGATVISPKKGYYKEPIATLDFASLYPSIMMAHNLCYSTLVSPDEVRTNVHNFDDSTWTKTPNGDYFVKPCVKKGILPEILEELLAARKRAKRDLKHETDPLRKAVLDGRQLALKVSANSVYGFTGAQVGKLPCLEISSSVTSFGRDMIEMTKSQVIEKYTVANGYGHDADVVYGDTDSVMIRFGITADDAPAGVADRERWMLEKSMELALEAADYVNEGFIKPIKLEFEKVYYPYLLMNKKRYAALMWTNPDKFDKMDCKGIETVRRDNCALVRIVIDKCLKTILMDRNVDSAIDYVKETVRRLLLNEIDISDLIITKAMNKTAEEMKAVQAHVVLAEKMRKRDPNTAPTLGDRVPYVIVKSAKGAKAFEKAEDPIYVLENNIPIDVKHYLDHQLSKPLMRLFEALMDRPDTLLSGEHTRQIKMITPTTGGLMQFVRSTPTCLGCRTPLKPDQKSVCDHCKPDESRICMQAVATVNEKQELFAKFWTQCQRCQGSLHQEVLCASRDCPIFYRRRKAQKDLVEAQNTLARFSW